MAGIPGLGVLAPIFGSMAGSGGASIWPDVLGAFGQLAGGYFNYLGQSQANSANRVLSQQQMEFQREMRNTSYQAAVLDAKKAGLNPALLYSQGGAATPAGSTATMVNANAGLAQGGINAISTALQLDNLRANTRLTNAQAADAEARVPFSAASADWSARKVRAETELLDKEWDRVDWNVQNLMIDEQLKREMVGRLTRAQDLDNRAKELGLKEKEAEALFWSHVPGGKFGQYGAMILKAMK